jgi:hypothetical protein
LHRFPIGKGNAIAGNAPLPIAKPWLDALPALSPIACPLPYRQAGALPYKKYTTNG